MVMLWVLNLSGHTVHDFRSSTSAKPSDQAAFFDFTNDSNDSLCSGTGANEAEFVSVQRERVGSSLVCGAGATGAGSDRPSHWDAARFLGRGKPRLNDFAMVKVQHRNPIQSQFKEVQTVFASA
jgi:hypothetical protein